MRQDIQMTRISKSLRRPKEVPPGAYLLDMSSLFEILNAQ